MSGARQLEAVVAAHRTRTHYRDFHSRSPRQHDFAKRPILDQMAQGFARLAEGIDPLDDRLDGSADNRDIRCRSQVYFALFWRAVKSRVFPRSVTQRRVYGSAPP